MRVPAGAVHVCYINTVSRFAFASRRVRSASRALVRRNGLVAWDREAAKRPTRFVANSHNVAERIRTYYGRDSDVLHCPVDLDRFSVGSGNGDYFIVASRLLPYKRIDLAIRAAAIADVPLVIAGTGPARAFAARARERHDDDAARLRIGRAAQRACRKRARGDRTG